MCEFKDSYINNNNLTGRLVCKVVLFCRGEKNRTSDLHVPNVARCQLCYTPRQPIELFLLNCGAKLVILFQITMIIFVKVDGNLILLSL